MFKSSIVSNNGTTCILVFNSCVSLISKNTTIPIFITDNKERIIDHNNIDEEIAKDSIALKRYFNAIKKDNQPIKMERSKNKYQLVYYGNSPLLNKLKYYPIALLLIIILFGAVVYNFYKATKMATQNKLWAGMAKETAHQIGTPLSSLIGWVEILKLENIEESTVAEIEKDINRLQTITDRFSKIGSMHYNFFVMRRDHFFKSGQWLFIESF